MIQEDDPDQCMFDQHAFMKESVDRYSLLVGMVNMLVLIITLVGAIIVLVNRELSWIEIILLLVIDVITIGNSYLWLRLRKGL